MASKTQIYDGSNWRPIKKTYVYDAGTSAWRLVKYSWVYDGTNWRQVHVNAYIFNKTFSTPASNYDLMDDIMAMPAPTRWNGTDDIEATITVNPGVTVYSTVADTIGYAMKISPSPSTNPSRSFPVGSVINLTLAGSIIGKGGTGGAGGAAQSTWSPSPNPSAPGKPFTVWSRSALAGANGQRGGNALVLGYPVNVTVPPTGSIKSGGGGGAGGGGSVAQFPGVPGVFLSYAAAAARGGGGGGGGAGNSISPAPAGSGGPGLANAAPPSPNYASVGNDGAVGEPAPASSYGAGGAPFGTTAISSYPFGVTAFGGAGGAGGAAGSGGSNGTAGTAPPVASPNPLDPAPTYNNVQVANGGLGTGGAAGTSIKGTSYFVSPLPLSSPQIVGPQTST